MKREFVAAESQGIILIENRFETPKGNYRIVIRKHKSNIYFFKYRDDKLLECQNLGAVKGKGVVSNG